MYANILELKNKFMEISHLGWICSLRCGPTGVGYTFETLLGKNEESSSFPDYNGIEIKTHRMRSHSYIGLFN